MSVALRDCIKKALGVIDESDSEYLMGQLDSGVNDSYALGQLEKLINSDITELADRVESEGGEVKREVKDGRAFHDFFQGVTSGTTGIPGISADYKPVVGDVVQQLQDETSALYKYNQEYNLHKGNFDQHIALSIPGYRDFQYKIGNAILGTFDKGVMLDIGASEGTQAKTITSLSGGKIQSISLDPLPAMQGTFDSTSTVEGASFSLTALGMDKETEGDLAWNEDDGTPIHNFDPKGQQYDIVQESMVFQFIDNNRADHIKRAADLTKDDGIAIFQEKLHNPDWTKNEAQKNEFKSLSFRKEDMDDKSAEVLEGMNKNMVSVELLEQELLTNFKHVAQIWDSGNFRGYAASNNFETIAKFQTNMGNTTSAFDTRKLKHVTIQPDSTGRDENGVLTSLPVTNGMTDVVHFSGRKGLEVLDPEMYGNKGAGAERQRMNSPNWINRIYYGIEPGTKGGYIKETVVGNNKYPISIQSHMVYDFSMDPDNLRETTINNYEKAIHDAGYMGYWINHPQYGMVGTSFDPIEIEDGKSKTTVLYQKGLGSDIGHKREKTTGRYVGAPAWIGNSPQKLGKLRRNLMQLTLEGERGRYWYENSSQAILDMAGGDKVEAERIVSLIAIFSPNATVPANTTMALTAYYQWKAGNEIKAGTGGNNDKATDLLVNGIAWDGIKTNSFYQNLMVEIDASKLDPGVSTMDMWMAIAFDSGSKTLDQGPKYKFAERETKRIADELGWSAHQVQAAIWSAMKGRVDPIRGELLKQELKKKIKHMVMNDKGKMVAEFVKLPDPNKKDNAPSERLNKIKHFRLAFKLGMAADLKDEHITDAKYDFSEALGERAAQMSWEATPSKVVDDIPGIHNATYDQKFEYLVAVQKAMTGADGQDLIAEAVGLSSTPHMFGVSAWEGETGAGAQTLIPVPPSGSGPKFVIKPDAVKAMNEYAAMRGLIMRQDGVAWHFPLFKDSKIRHNGFELNVGRPMNEAEVNQLYTAIHAEFGTWELAPIYTSNGVRILNFVEGLSNADFQKRMKKIMDGIEGDVFNDSEAVAYRSEGDMMTNDWKENKNGEGYLQGSLKGRPDLHSRAADLRTRIETVNKEFTKKYGWDKEGEVVLSQSGRLDMSKKARLKRAVKMGFDVATTWYHGTTKTFDQFEGLTFLTSSTSESSAYAGTRELYLSNAKDKQLGRIGKTTLPDNQLNVMVDYVGIISDIEQDEDRIPGKVWATDQGVIRFTEKGFDFVTNAEPDYNPKNDYVPGKAHIKSTDSTTAHDEYIDSIKDNYEGETDFGDGQVLPVFIKEGKYKKLEALQANKFGKRLQGKDTDTQELQDEIDGYIKEGYIGIETLSDEGVMFMGKEIPQRVVFDPANIRSINAAFDPAESKNPKILSQPGFHGTPHKVDKFTTDKIGTGEGNQAFGWGMYFAGNREVAEFYKNQISRQKLPRVTYKGKLLDAPGDINNDQEFIASTIALDGREGAKELFSTALDMRYLLDLIDTVKDEDISVEKTQGNLYQVELAPEDHEYLKWNDPIEKQPEHIQQKFMAMFGRPVEFFQALDMTGEDMYGRAVREYGGEKEASEKLHEMGIRGIKYLDAGSRGPAGGSHNFVIFSDDDVAIVEQFEQFERGRIYLNDDSRTIQLLEASDLSTFLHEGAHLFLEMEKVFAKKYGLSKDQETMLEWLGADSFDDITVEMHEKWAETFESYLREGKAPSLSLRRAFASFARWLKVIYRSIRDQRLQNADLTPEITEVFDRLLATSDEIAQAAANPAYDQYFRSKEQAGMSDAQWAEYQLRASKISQTAEMKLDEKVIKQYMKMKTSEWNDEKAPITEQMKEDLSKERVHQVRSDLKVFKDDDGIAHEGRMDTKLLKDALGLKKLDGKLIGKHVKKGGVDPALMAESYEYPSVQAMYDDLVNAPTLKKASEDAAEAVMVEKYGDMLKDGTIEQEVREAMVNDDQAKMLLMEINALKKKARQPGINREYLKAQATTLIGGMKFSEIKPDKYYRQMVKAAQDAVTLEDPSNAKIQQLMNHYTYKEALRVKEQMTKDRKKVKGFQTRAYDTKKVAADYVQQIKMLSGMYDLRNKPEQLIQLGQIVDFYHAQRTALGGELTDLTMLDPNLIRAVEYREVNGGNLQGFELVQFDDLTAEDLKGVVDMLEHLRFVGKAVAKETSAETTLSRLALAESVRSKGGKDHKTNRKSQRIAEGARRLWNYNVNTLPSLGNMAKKLDGMVGGGEAFTKIYMKLSEGNDRKMRLNKQFYEEFKEMMGDMSDIGLSRMDVKEFQLESGESWSFSSEEIFMIGVYWGTESSREAIMEGHGMSQGDVARILSTLTDGQLKMINATWAMNESQWPDLSQAALALSGVAPPKLAAVPFIVNGVEMTGGHMQLMYDSQKLELSNEQEAGMLTASVMPTKHGSLNARVGSGGKPVLLDIGNITRSVDSKIHYIAFAKIGQELRSLINNDDVKGAIEQKHGPGFLDAFIESIEGVTGNRQANEAHKGFAAAMRWTRQAATIKHLTYSVRNTVQQPAAMLIAMKEVGFMPFTKASAQLLSQRRQTVDYVNSLSGFMEDRAQVVNRDAREAMKIVMSTSKKAAFWEKFKAHGFIMQTVVDSTIAYPTWLAAYENAMEEHGETKRASVEADSSVARSVGSGSDLHLSRLFQSNQSELTRTATFFGSWFNAYYQRLYASSKGGDDFLNLNFALEAFALPFIVANITQMLVLDMPDDDEEIEEYLLKNTVNFGIGTVPLLREMSSIAAGFTPSTAVNAIPAALYHIPAELTKFAQGDQTGLKTLSDTGKLLTGVIKVPMSGQLWRALDYTDSYIEGNEGDFNIYQMLAEGKDRDK